MGCIPIRDLKNLKNRGTAEIDPDEEENSLFTIKEESSELEQSHCQVKDPKKLTRAFDKN